MKKYHSVRAAWMAGGLVWGIASASIAQQITPPQSSSKGHRETSEVRVSRAGKSGVIVANEAAVRTAQARSEQQTTNHVASLANLTPLARAAGAVGTVSEAGSIAAPTKIAARQRADSGTVAVSRVSDLGQLSLPSTQLARTAGESAAEESFINRDLLAQPRLAE